MKELLEKIKKQAAEFLVNANAQVDKGTKAAGARSRKASMELGGLLKEWRKVSVKGE